MKRIPLRAEQKSTSRKVWNEDASDAMRRAISCGSHCPRAGSVAHAQRMAVAVENACEIFIGVSSARWRRHIRPKGEDRASDEPARGSAWPDAQRMLTLPQPLSMRIHKSIILHRHQPGC